MDLSIYQRPEIELVDSKMCLGFGKALNYLWTVFITNAADCAATNRNKHF